MRSQFLVLITCLLISLITNAQSELIVSRYVQLPKDSVVSKQLISDLNNFLISTQEPNSNNLYILPKEKIETFILIDEFKGIENSRGFKDKHFYKPYLTNVLKMDSSKYLIQLSHIGVSDSIPYLRTEFKLIAQKSTDKFLFSSPLIENTKKWKTKSIKNCIFYYRDTLNLLNARDYVNMSKDFDKN